MLRWALEHDGPVAIRYAKAAAEAIARTALPVELGKAEVIGQGKDGCLIACGSMLIPCAEAAKRLAAEGVDLGVINARFVKPLDGGTILATVADMPLVVTVEEGVLMGGFGSTVLEAAADTGLNTIHIHRLGIPDRFIEHGPRTELLADLGLDAAGIVRSCQQWLGGARARPPPAESWRDSDDQLPVYLLTQRCKCGTIITTGLGSQIAFADRWLRREVVMPNAFSAKLKELRINTGLSLREFCLRNGLDPGNYSKLERGHFPPPESHALLEKYAMALGLAPGTSAWLELFDLAAAERGRIPADIMSDEALVAKLPVLFRTMRNSAVAGATRPTDRAGSPELMDGFQSALFRYGDLRRYAEKFLAQYHPGRKVPVPIEEIIDVRLGIDIVPMPGLGNFDTVAYLSPDLAEIRVQRIRLQASSQPLPIQSGA